ncbi:MAG TPA: alpha/beta hydrolase [Anaeromyxobacteraceae bacterium]|nr:alpha/beta hydrolase [Anaeromyxobacteraceae bacterium]
MPFADVETPLRPGVTTRLHYRERGSGPALVLLHSGWGYEAYPFTHQLDALSARYRIVVPDRTGYGASEPLDELPEGYHRLYALETLRLLDRLGIGPAVLWGHSDGAVVAAWTAIEAPVRVRGLVLEAFHFWRGKVASIPFFETGANRPEEFGEAKVAALRLDHGEGRWRGIVGAGARAWLRIIARGRREGGDLYDARLGEVRCPALLLHGSHDPRSEPGEIEAARAALPDATLEFLDTGHAPHSSARMGGEATRIAERFLARLPEAPRVASG